MQKIKIEFYREENPVINDAFDRLIAKVPMLKAQTGSNLFTVTACEPDVGSTTISINIAVAMANSGWKTLLIDADIRKKPNQKRLYDNFMLGFSDCLTGVHNYEDIITDTNFDNLHFLSCGSFLDNPITLFNSRELDVFLKLIKEKYDYVIFDSSALNTTIDSAILASKTAGAIMVAKFNHTKMSKIDQSIRELDQTGAKVLGVVLNNVPKDQYKRYIEHYDYFISNAKKIKKKFKTK